MLPLLNIFPLLHFCLLAYTVNAHPYVNYNVLMYMLLICMARDVLIFDAGKPITGPFEGVVPENRVAMKWQRS
jgi:hypothetical protein